MLRNTYRARLDGVHDKRHHQGVILTRVLLHGFNYFCQHCQNRLLQKMLVSRLLPQRWQQRHNRFREGRYLRLTVSRFPFRSVLFKIEYWI